MYTLSDYVIRTQEDKEKIIDAIRGASGSWKIYIEPLLPKATADQYRYLFGVVYKYIADYCGYTNVQEVHRGHMALYNLVLEPPDWELRIKSASEFSRVEITMYIEKIRSDWLLDCDLVIPDANEII